MRPEGQELPERYFSVDVLRGLAALGVLLWHYQHFYVQEPGGPPTFDWRAQQPWYPALWLFYERGYLAVEFFWALSGFVFAAVYAGRATSASVFLVHRVSRLYPLHALTLLAVTALQVLSVARLGRPQIFGHLDVRHFVLNALFISGWGLESGYSFNGPVWSVSIELAVYVLFYLLLPALFRRGLLYPLALAGAGWLLVRAGVGQPFAACVFFFFLGVACQRLLALTRTAPTTGLLVGAACVVLALWSPARIPALFSAALLGAGWLDIEVRPPLARRLRWLGESTYGVYLWHIPVQVALLVILDDRGVPRTVADEPWFLVSFVAAVLAVARLSFLTFELPAQRWWRQALLGQAATALRAPGGGSAGSSPSSARGRAG